MMSEEDWGKEAPLTIKAERKENTSRSSLFTSALIEKKRKNFGSKVKLFPTFTFRMMQLVFRRKLCISFVFNFS